MARARWALYVDIYEESVGPDYPVVQHAFFGQTKAEAEGYYRAHQTTDSFLKGCLRGRWDGVVCYTRRYWRQL